MNGIDRPPLRWLGSKFRLAREIIAHFPPHQGYCEPYGGGGSVLWQKPRAYNEVYNDLDGELVNMFRVLRSPAGGELLRQLRLTPYARSEYQLALEPCAEPIERARRLIVRSHLAHGTGGARIDRPTGFRRDGRTCTTNVAGEWADLPDALEAIRERIVGVELEQVPALSLVERYSDPKWLIYLDPPYVPQTRSTKSAKGGEKYHTYAHEMTDDDHIALLDACEANDAMIIISGYPCPLYDDRLRHWSRHEFAARAHRNSPRTEVIWKNRAASEALAAGPLFAAA